MPSVVECLPDPPRQLCPQVDPVNHPRPLTISVRTLSTTNMILQSLIAAEGLTFWGEGISLILAFCALNPDWCDLENLEDAPRGLTTMGGALRYPGTPVSKGIMTPLSAEVHAWVRSVAARYGIAVEKAATLILYRNAASVAAHIQAARAGE